jgi:hypothetical protein
VILILDMFRAYDWLPEPKPDEEDTPKHMFMPRWAVWDTCRDQFLSWDGEWAWDNREELRQAIVGAGREDTLADPSSFAARAYAMMPDSVDAPCEFGRLPAPQP